MKKLILLLSLLLLSASSQADQFGGHLGFFGVDGGQPDTEQDRFLINLFFETSSLWRFSYTDTSFEGDDEDSAIESLTSRIISAERIWVYKVKENFSLIGAFGPAYYSTDLEITGGQTFSNTAIGIAASGSLRFALSASAFIDGAFHYRNAAVTMDSFSVNGGYQGIVLGGGLFF